jgi:hypothetical protein
MTLIAGTGTPLEQSTVMMSSPAPLSNVNCVSLFLSMVRLGGFAGDVPTLNSNIVPAAFSRT